MLKAGGAEVKQPFNLLIDPRLAEEGVTVADLQEQFEHNVRMQAMVAEVGQILRRAQEALRNAPEGSESRKALEAVVNKIQTEPVRYGKPGLQAHITYLAGMTSRVDMKIGRDAIARHDVLRKELDAVAAELGRLIGTGTR